jgi:hypothetical protein
MQVCLEEADDLLLGLARELRLSMSVDEAHSRAEALFKKEQQLREGQQAMAEYQTKLDAMREKTARLRALRLARDAANQKTPPTNRRGMV